MSVSSYSQQNNWPYGAVAQLANGKTTAISNSYVGTLTAGYYAFSAVSLNDKASALVLSSASTNTTIRIKSKETEYFELTSSASDIVFESEGAIPTGETTLIGRYPTGASLYTVAFGQNKYVIAGSSATTNAYVSDGINGAYTPYNMGVSGGSSTVSWFGNNKFVIAGSGTTGGLTSSTDAVTWTTSLFGRGHTWTSVKYLNNLWVAVGNRATLATSTDAITWNWISGQMPTSGSVWSMTTGPSFALAATQSGYVNISTTGVGWDFTHLSTSSVALRTVVYANSLYVTAGASGYLATSTDGRNWTARTSGFGSTQIQEVNFGASTWVAVGQAGQLRTSTDAITWTTRTSGFGSTNINSVAYGNVWVAAGDTGVMKTSTDAITWGTVTSGFGTTAIQKVRYLNNLWLAVGTAGQLRTSTDATTWTTRTSGFGTSIIYDMTYFSSRYVAVGAGGTIRYSTDAVTWSNATWDTQPTNIIYAITEENGRLFAGAAAGYVFSSTDGIAWSQFYNAYSGAAIVNGAGVAYANSVYTVATGSASVNTTSTDGVTWNRNTTTQNLSDVIAGATDFKGVVSGVFYTSTDGITYTLVVDISKTGITNLIYSDNQYVAYGTTTSGTDNLYTSPDFTTWTARTYTSTTATIYDLVRGGGTSYVAVDSVDLNVGWSTTTVASSWRRAGIGSTAASAIAQNENFIVAAGGDNILYAPTTTPTVWTQTVNADATIVYAAAASPISFALATDSGLMFSTNATTWTIPYALIFSDVVYDSFSGVFLAANGSNRENFVWMTNASSASATEVIVTGFDSDPFIRKIAAYNGWYLLGASNGQVAISRGYKNAADFICQTLDVSSSIIGVAIGDEFATALTDLGDIYYCKLSEISDQAFLSINTLTTTSYYVTQNWQLAYTPAISRTYTGVGMAYNNGTFVALMTGGVMFSSTDGANWSTLSIGQATDMGTYTGIAPYSTGQFYLNTFGTVSQTTGGSLPSAFSLYQVNLPNL